MVGFDYEWDKHVIDAIFPRDRKRGDLWYVNEEQTTEDSPIFFHLQACEAKRLEEAIGGYELFFVNLCWYTLGIIPTYQITLDKLATMEKMLNEMQDIQRKLQNDLGLLTKTVNTLLQSQKDINEDIKGLSAKVDTLLTQPTPTSLSDSTSVPSADTPSATLQEKKQRPTRKPKQLEEN
jgi:uncharacterized protein YoxC